jgi:hypothetical protein
VFFFFFLQLAELDTILFKTFCHIRVPIADADDQHSNCCDILLHGIYE